MTDAERIERVKEVQKAVATLVKAGWELESIAWTDASGEPFRAEIVVAVGSARPEAQVV